MFPTCQVSFPTTMSLSLQANDTHLLINFGSPSNVILQSSHIICHSFFFETAGHTSQCLCTRPWQFYKLPNGNFHSQDWFLIISLLPYWNRRPLTLPLPSISRKKDSYLVESDCLWPHGLYPTRLICGILEAGILEWVAISFSRGSSQPGNETQVSAL